MEHHSRYCTGLARPSTTKILILFLLYSFSLFSQTSRRASVNGYVMDAETGETLIGSHIVDAATGRGVTANAFGFFSMVRQTGEAVLTVHYIGYQTQTLRLNVTKDTTLTVLLVSRPYGIDEVVVQASGISPEVKLSQPQMGMMNLSGKELKGMPMLLGEADVMRTIQVLPGIQAASERGTGISVRGGSIDQNLFLLDDAPVFQISHFMGFSSIFGTDAVKDVKVYKGDMPANYGGRISSVVDIRLKDGNMRKFSMSGGIGLLSSSLSVDGPIVQDRVSFLASGKYGYLGWLAKRLGDDGTIGEVTFYDMNLKLNAVIDPKNRIYLSSYNGGDNDGLQRAKYWNNALSLRWNHVYTARLFGNVSFIYSNYRYRSQRSADTEGEQTLSWNTGIRQAALKGDFNWYINDKNTLDFGVAATYQRIIPGRFEGNYKDSMMQIVSFSNRIAEQQDVMDYAAYVSNEQKLTKRLSVRYGIRANMYQNLGGHWVYRLNDNYEVADSFHVDKGKTYAAYFNIEPRVSLNYRAFQNSAVKASYTYTTQQTQMLTKTNGGGPMDMWFSSGENIRPQTSTQYALGWVQYLFDHTLEASVEGYYKDMNHIIDYKDGATLLSRAALFSPEISQPNFEEQLRAGKGWAYGVETMVKGNVGAFDGFVSYTYARSWRQIDDINNGKTYRSPFDKPHTFDLFLNYSVNKRVSLSTNLRLQSGQAITVPIYVMKIYGKVMTGYGERNSYRLPYYQRIDVSLTLKNKEKPNRKWNSEWNFSIINLLNHANIYYINFMPDEDNPTIINAMGQFMLGIFPSASWRFNF